MAGFTVNRATVRRRLLATFIITALLTLLLVGRLALIQIVWADQLYEQAWKQWNRNVPIYTARGSIYDCHGRLLAGTSSVDTIAAVPPHVKDPQTAAEALAPVLDMESERIKELITMERSSIFIKRKVDSETAEAVREMNIPGIIFFTEEKRDYPGDNIAPQLLGFVGMDEGLAGLEYYYEDYLKGGESRLYYPADGRGRQLPHYFNRFVPPRQNYDLFLSIDETIQYIVQKELAVIMEETAPKQAMALVVDPQTGAVLAAAGKPDYKPKAFERYDPESWTLAPFNSSFEPGSTFKLVTLAAALEENLIDLNETHHCTGNVVVNDHRINCWTTGRGGHGEISFSDALAGSCNPTFIEMGRRLGEEKLLHYIEGFGFGRATGIDYPGESRGMIFNPGQMGPLELATTTFGQGITVTPIQQVMAVTAMINGGYLLKPYLVKEIRDQNGDVYFKHEPEIIRQVISENTSVQLMELMETVITEGTAKAAASDIYRLAGKTGMAQILGSDGEYKSGQYIHSLVGFAPVENPRVVLYVAVDSITRGPQSGSYTSAPLFKRIMEDILNYLQVTPSSRLESELETG